LNPKTWIIAAPDGDALALIRNIEREMAQPRNGYVLLNCNTCSAIQAIA